MGLGRVRLLPEPPLERHPGLFASPGVGQQADRAGQLQGVVLPVGQVRTAGDRRQPDGRRRGPRSAACLAPRDDANIGTRARGGLVGEGHRCRLGSHGRPLARRLRPEPRRIPRTRPNAEDLARSWPMSPARARAAGHPPPPPGFTSPSAAAAVASALMVDPYMMISKRGVQDRLLDPGHVAADALLRGIDRAGPADRHVGGRPRMGARGRRPGRRCRVAGQALLLVMPPGLLDVAMRLVAGGALELALAAREATAEGQGRPLGPDELRAVRRHRPFDAWHSLQDLRRAAAGVLDVWAIAIRANPDSTALTSFSPGP